MIATPLMTPYVPASVVASPAMSPDLASVAEVAEICGVPKRTAFRYIQRGDFPKPIERLAAGPIWRRADIEEWAAKTLPLPTGRPPKPKT